MDALTTKRGRPRLTGMARCDMAILNTAVPHALKSWLIAEANREDRSLVNFVRRILEEEQARRAQAACEEATP